MSLFNRASQALFQRASRIFADAANMDSARESYILGNGSGRWDDPDDTTKFLARKDDEAPVESFSLGSNVLLDPWDGCPVVIGWEDGERCIVAMSRTGLKAQGINPKRYNPADTRLHGWGSKEGLPDWSVQAIGTLANPSTKFVVQPNAYYDDEYQFQASLRIQGDSASYIPGAGLQRLLCVAVKPDLTLHYSPSTAQSVATDFDTSDFQECLATLYPRATPVIWWRLADDADRLTDADKFMDGRMIFNIMPPRMNWSATTDPDENDDETVGYGILSLWVNTTTDTAWMCVKADEDNAVWNNLGASGPVIALTSPGGTISIAESPAGTFAIDVADGAIGLEQLADGTPDTALGFDGSGNPTEIPIDNDGTLAANSASRLATQQAVKSYVDAVAQGLSVKHSVLASTTAALPANTYANGSSGVGATLTADAVGALTIDGQAIALNDRVLIKDEAAPEHNGIYVCTTAGSGGAAFVLTRALDFNQPSEIPGAFTFTENGTVNDGIGFVVADPGPFTIGTTAIPWTQFSGAGQINAGTGLTKTGNTLAIDTAIVATLTGAQTLANKVLSQLHLLIGGFKAIFTHAFTADRTVTLPGDADVTLVGVATAQTLTNKTLTSPKVNEILDSNGNEQIKFTTTASAVNESTFTNAATGTNPKIEATGGDTNIGLDILTKGTGVLNLDAPVVINESGADRDTRIESDADPNMLFVDGGNNNIGIGTNTPNASALMHMVSTTKGFLPPSMTAAQRDAIGSPAMGMLVYLNDQGDYSFYRGEWYNLFHPFRSITINPFSEHTVVAGAAIIWTSNTAQAGAGYYQRSAAAQNDDVEYLVAIPVGTYHIEYLVAKTSSSGIMSLSLDGGLISAHDLYAAVAATNTRGSSSNFNVTSGGVKTLSIKVASKNASSSGYASLISWLQIIRTAEYPP